VGFFFLGVFFEKLSVTDGEKREYTTGKKHDATARCAESDKFTILAGIG
jgi:hypothetical protein